MNSYSLNINFSWWYPAILIIAGFLFAWFVYRRTLPPLPPSIKAILTALRGIAIGLLLFAIFEPVLSIIKGAIEKPRLALMLDNSISAGMKDAKFNRSEQYKQILAESNPGNLGKEQLMLYLFDSETKLYEDFDENKLFDSLNFKGQLTDLSKPLKLALKNSEKDNIQAALLITDGAFNTGNNPVYDADLFGKPVYVIGIGDTNEPKDVVVQSIITNDIGYVENPFPVNVTLSSSGFDEGEIKVKLLDNGATVSEQTVRLTKQKQGDNSQNISGSNQNTYNLIFEYNPTSEGIHKLTVVASSIEGEISKQNNSISEFVEILKNKRRILIFAGSPNPDLTFVRNTLANQKGIEIKTFIQKQGAEFYEGVPTTADLSNSEMIFFIGFPIVSTPNNVLEMIKGELSKDKPLFIISSQNMDFNKLKIIEDYLPFIPIANRPNEFNVLADFNSKSISNPVLKINANEKDIELWNKLPPIFKTEANIRVKPESEVLATFKVNDVQIKEPLIISRTFQNKKSIVVLGYGLYRWKLLGYASDLSKGRTDTKDLYEIFINNTHRWLSSPIDKKNIFIKTTRKFYSKGENVEFIAQVYDASFSPIDNANVEVKTGSGEDTRNIILQSMGNGRYTSSVSGLKEGDYYFSGDVKVNGVSIGTDKGRFSIGDIATEYRDMKMNIELLRNIAERTGGKFYTYENAASFINDLLKNPRFKEKSLTSRLEYALWNLPWILALAILLLSVEWFLRKRFGLV